MQHTLFSNVAHIIEKSAHIDKKCGTLLDNMCRISI